MCKCGKVKIVAKKKMSELYKKYIANELIQKVITDEQGELVWIEYEDIDLIRICQVFKNRIENEEDEFYDIYLNIEQLENILNEIKN